MIKRIGVFRGIAVALTRAGVVLGAPAGVSAAGGRLTSVAGRQRAARVLWLARYHGLGYGQPRAMVVSQDGSTVFVTGFTKGGPVIEATTVAFSAATGARLCRSPLPYSAATGTQLWTVRHSATSGQSEAQAVAVSPDGGKVFVLGQSPAPNGHLVYTVIAYSS